MIKKGDERLGCCSTLMKSLMVLINGLLALIGIATIGIGVSMKRWQVSEITGDGFSYLTICFGIFVLFMGFLGFLSACKRWTFGLWMFSILQFLIICAEVVGVIYCFTSWSTIEKFIGARWNGLDEESKESFQEQFSCCGWDASITGKNCPDGVALDGYCWQSIKDVVEDEIRFVVYAASGIIFLEIIMLVFTISVRHELLMSRNRKFIATMRAQMYNL